MNPDPVLAVRARGLVKFFGSKRVLGGVNLDVNAGSVYGVIGHAGAGKTTLLRIIGAELRPNAGTARVFGHDVILDSDQVRSRVMLTGNKRLIDENLTIRENIIVQAEGANGIGAPNPARIHQIIDAFGSKRADLKVRECPPRLLRCLDVALGIVSGPDLLLLDEPTMGLDRSARDRAWEILRTFVADGLTVLVATRYLDEASRLADRIAVLDRGRVVAGGRAEDLLADAGSDAIRIRLRDPGDRFRAERLLFETLGVLVFPERDPEMISAQVSDPEAAALALAELSVADIEVVTFTFGRSSVGQMFLNATDDAAHLPAPGEQAEDTSCFPAQPCDRAGDGSDDRGC